MRKSVCIYRKKIKQNKLNTYEKIKMATKCY